MSSSLQRARVESKEQLPSRRVPSSSEEREVTYLRHDGEFRAFGLRETL
ncbi:hypothetical protein ACWEVP_08245 [Amycolatopsis sp. NPDC003865]